MIREAVHPDETEYGEGEDILKWKRLLALSVATSIDALAAGFSYAMLEIPILVPALVTGGVTFTLSAVGVKAGSRLRCFFAGWIEVAGGIILILIGVKILMDHLFPALFGW